MDWDISVAKAANAGPLYRDMMMKMGPELQAARDAGDRVKLGAVHRVIFDAYVHECADTMSPRIKDPVYREAILARMVFGQVAAETDPQCIATMAALVTATSGLQYVTTGEYKYDESYNVIAEPKTTIKPETFWAMMDAFTAKVKALTVAMEDPSAPPDPDDTPPALGAKVGNSMMVQGWIKFLDDKTAAEVLELTHLRDEYQDIAEPALHDAACPGCSRVIHAAEGAVRVVCAHCGIYITLGRKLFCGYCGAPMTFGIGAKTSVCGSCKAETRLMNE
jgi:hypothetical protein